MSKRDFRVIDGGTGNETLVRVTEPDGGGSGGGGDGVTPPLWKLDVRRDVQIAKWGLAGLLAVFLYCFIYFNGELIDVRKDISGVNANVAAQSATLSNISRAVDRIEIRLDGQNANQSQAGSGRGQTGAIHRRTGSGAKRNQ